MNFNENTKENKYYSNSPHNKSTCFPMIFTKFETEKNIHRDFSCDDIGINKIFLPYYKDLKQEMSKIKKEFRNLFNIKNTVFKEMITKKNSITYQNFIHGFGKYFFGPKGIVTKKYKYLSEYYGRNYDLNDKIFVGKLEYYDNINNFNNYQQRQNEANKKILYLNKNYAIVNDKNDIYSMKAITSKRLVKKDKNYVLLNKQRYKNILTEIYKISERNKKINNININSKKEINNKNRIKIKLNLPVNLKTYKKFHKNNNQKNIFNIYKKLFNDIKNIYNKINTKNNSSNSYVNINARNKQINNISNSNLFLTQCPSVNNININLKKINNRNIKNNLKTSFSNKSQDRNNSFNKKNDLKISKIRLNKLNNKIFRNMSFNF